MAESHLFYGRNVLVEALAARVKISEIYFANDQAKKFVEDLRLPRIPMKNSIPGELRQFNHQGIAFKAEHDFYLKHWDIEQNKFDFILLCNHLEDVQNLGSLTRAATAFGVGLLVHEERRSARMNAAGLKVSAGQAFRMKFLEVSNLTPFCRKLDDAGYSIIGLDMAEDSASLYKWTPQVPVALVVGSESDGLSKPVRGAVHMLVHIPMLGGVESLNANQAASIAMSWVFEKIQK